MQYSHFATVTGGLEDILIEEISKKWNESSKTKKCQGKVFFNCKKYRKDSLRSCERVFVCCFQTSFSGFVNKAVVNRRIWDAAEDTDWEESINNWTEEMDWNDDDEVLEY